MSDERASPLRRCWAVVGVISSLITIFVFISGKASLSTVFSIFTTRDGATLRVAPAKNVGNHGAQPKPGADKDILCYKFRFDAEELNLYGQHLYKPDVIFETSTDYWLMTEYVTVAWGELHIDIDILVKNGLDHQVVVRIADLDLMLVDGGGTRYTCVNVYHANPLMLPGETTSLTFRFKRTDGKDVASFPPSPFTLFVMQSGARMTRSIRILLDGPFKARLPGSGSLSGQTRLSEFGIQTNLSGECDVCRRIEGRVGVSQSCLQAALHLAGLRGRTRKVNCMHDCGGPGALARRRANFLGVSCAAGARVPKPKRRGGCRQ